MIVLMFIFPATIGLLRHKSPTILPQSKNIQKITYLETETGKIKECELEEYLIGVLAAEMPAEYHIEALKAQAVAARSFIISRINETNPDHPNAVVCDDSTHCKAHWTEDAARQKWQKGKADQYWSKLKSAVDETAGEYMICEDQVVEAFFFARSNGKTENSEDVWTSQVAYLRSVKSEGDEKSPKFHSQKEMTIDEFKRIAEEKIEGVSWDDYIIGDIERSDAGGIKTIDVGGISVKGSDFRFMYDLRSANIQIEIIEEVVKMDVKGYGHGVGMSQYGADYLARQGKNFEDILKTYYTGVSLDECKKST